MIYDFEKIWNEQSSEGKPYRTFGQLLVTMTAQTTLQNVCMKCHGTTATANTSEKEVEILEIGRRNTGMKQTHRARESKPERDIRHPSQRLTSL